MAREPTTVPELGHELKAAERLAQVLGIGLAVLIALGCGDLSSTISAEAPRWLFFAFAFVAGFSVARGWVESHAGLRRIDLEADAAEIKENYDNACAWIAVAIWPVAGACYLVVVGWWAFG